MGDVVQTQGNLLGDGVNIAARLEALYVYQEVFNLKKCL